MEHWPSVNEPWEAGKGDKVRDGNAHDLADGGPDRDLVALLDSALQELPSTVV